MSNFAKKLGVFMISIILVGIPFVTGLRIGMVGEVDFLALCGITLTMLEVSVLMGCYSFFVDMNS